MPLEIRERAARACESDDPLTIMFGVKANEAEEEDMEDFGPDDLVACINEMTIEDAVEPSPKIEALLKSIGDMKDDEKVSWRMVRCCHLANHVET